MQSVYGECVCVCVCQSSSVLCVSENRVPWFQGAVCHSRVPPLSAASLRDVLGSLILSIVGGIHPRSLCSFAPSPPAVFPPPLLTPSTSHPLTMSTAYYSMCTEHPGISEKETQLTHLSSGDWQLVSDGAVFRK